MIDWKPGDELICVGTDSVSAEIVKVGETYVFDRFVQHGPACGSCTDCGVRDGIEVLLVGIPQMNGYGLCHCQFRKPESKTDKQSLTEWLKQPSGDTDHLDKPLPAKKRERV
jgi:hypothetical protein